MLFGVLRLPGDHSHPFAQPTINPLACCICWAGLLGRAVFPPWNEAPNFGSYNEYFSYSLTSLVFVSSHFYCLLTGAFSPFKVIIDGYVLTGILLFCSSLLSPFSLALFPCDLMTIFSTVWISFFCMGVYYILFGLWLLCLYIALYTNI